MRSKTGALFVAFLLLALPGKGHSRLDDGGAMSRQLAVGKFCDGGTGEACDNGTFIETVYATTQEDGDPGNTQKDDPLTLWAFCPPGEGDVIADVHPAEVCAMAACETYDPADPPDDFCSPPCKWRAPVVIDPNVAAPALDVGSGKVSFAPPAVTSDGTRIFAASENGDDSRIYAFDNCGNQDWSFNPPVLPGNIKTNKNGFYAGLTVFEPSVGQPIVFAVNYGANNKAFLHAIEDVSSGNPTSEWTNYPMELPFSKVRYTPVLDTRCQDCEDYPRVYIASQNTGKVLMGINVHPDDPACGGTGTGPCVAWCSGPGSVPGKTCEAGVPDGYRLGGVIVPHVQLRDTGSPTDYGDVLVSQLVDGVVAHHLDACPTCSPSWKIGELDWAVGGLTIDQTHRSMPVLSVNEREPDHILGSDPTDPVAEPVVYVTTRNGAATRQLTQFNPAVASTAPTAAAPPAHRKLYPKSGDPGVGTSSYAWAVPNPTTGMIYWGGATDSGIHRVNRRIQLNVPNPIFSHELEATAEWFDYIPPNAWRTSPAFSGDGRWMHIGSAEAVFFNIDPDGRKGRALSCFDTRTGQGSPCLKIRPVEGGLAPCCTAMTTGVHEDSMHIDEGSDATLDYHELPCRKSPLEYEDCSTYDTFFVYPLISSAEVLFSAVQNIAWNPVTQRFETLMVLAGHPIGGVAGEVMNETTGQYRAMTPDVISWFAAIPLKPGVDNSLRYAMFDKYGNETVRRLIVTGVPSSLP